MLRTNKLDPDAEERARRATQLNRLVEQECDRLGASGERLNGFATFFSRLGIASRWSARNGVALYAQRPHWQRPVTLEEAEKTGHRLKPGVRPAEVLAPARISPELAARNPYLAFRCWAHGRGLTEEALERLCARHKAHCLEQGTDFYGSPQSKFALRELVIDTYPGLKNEDATRLAAYARQYLVREGAFDPQEVLRGQQAYWNHAPWEARPAVVDLGVDTEGSPLRPGPAVVPNAADERRHAAALLRFMEAKGWGSYQALLENIESPSARFDYLLRDAVVGLAREHRRGRTWSVDSPQTEMALFCICSQLGIERTFNVSTREGWGVSGRQFLRRLSLIGKVQKEIIKGVGRELKTIAHLETALAKTQGEAEVLRARLEALGLGEKKIPPAPESSRPPLRRPLQGAGQPEGLYFKVGRHRPVFSYLEVAQFLAERGLSDPKGNPWRIEIGRYGKDGADRQVLCSILGPDFARELLNSGGGRPVLLRQMDAALRQEEARRQPDLQQSGAGLGQEHPASLAAVRTETRGQAPEKGEEERLQAGMRL